MRPMCASNAMDLISGVLTTIGTDELTTASPALRLAGPDKVLRCAERRLTMWKLVFVP